MLNVLVGGVVLFVFGAIWYTALFGKIWAKLNGFGTGGGDMSMKSMAKPMVLNFLTQVLMAYSVYKIAPQLLSLNFSDLWCYMLIIWLGFSFTIYANQAIWERKPWNLVWLNSAYGVIGVTIISAIAYYWPAM